MSNRFRPQNINNFKTFEKKCNFIKMRVKNVLILIEDGHYSDLR